MADSGIFCRDRTESRLFTTGVVVLCGLGWCSVLWPRAAAAVGLVLVAVGLSVVLAWRGVRIRRRAAARHAASDRRAPVSAFRSRLSEEPEQPTSWSDGVAAGAEGRAAA